MELGGIILCYHTERETLRPSACRTRHLLFGFKLWQVQIPVFITYDSLLIFFQLLLRFCIQTSLHELRKHTRSSSRTRLHKGGEQHGYLKTSNTCLSHQRNQSQDCNYTTVAHILQNKHGSVRVRLFEFC